LRLLWADRLRYLRLDLLNEFLNAIGFFGCCREDLAKRLRERVQLANDLYHRTRGRSRWFGRSALLGRRDLGTSGHLLLPLLFLVLHGLETAVDFQALMPLVSALFVALYFVLCHDVSPLG
jgi:hypothetical protein